jgi:nucleoid-associated protein YgaU
MQLDADANKVVHQSQLDITKFYLIRASNGTSVLCLRGDGAPQIEGGGARYDVVNRPRRRSVVQWNGDDPYRMLVPIMLDGWSKNQSIEGDAARINQMMHSQGELTPPVTLFIDGALPVKGAKWVIESIDWGDRVIWGAGGRLRQDLTLHVLQYLSENILQLARKPGATTPYRVKAGETMAAIAARWGVTVPEIKLKNNIRDPKTIKTNQILLIPPSKFGALGG